MLYLLADWFSFPGLANLIRYQSFRAGAALMTALALSSSVGLAEAATVRGTLASDRLHSAQLALLDFRDQTISFGDGRPDTQSGVFVLHYKPLVDGRARKLRVTATGCKPQDSALARAQLRAETRISKDFTCVPG